MPRAEPMWLWGKPHKHTYKLKSSYKNTGHARVFAFKCSICYDVIRRTSYQIWHPEVTRWITPGQYEYLSTVTEFTAQELKDLYEGEMAKGKTCVVVRLERRLDGTWTNMAPPSQQKMMEWSR